MSSPNRNILSDIFCIGVSFLCHLLVVCTVFFTGIFCGFRFWRCIRFLHWPCIRTALFTVKLPLAVREQRIDRPVMALCHGLSCGTVASLHYREPVKIIQFLSGNDQLGRIHVNRIVPFSVDLHLAGRRKVCSLDIIGVIRRRRNLNGSQRRVFAR